MKRLKKVGVIEDVSYFKLLVVRIRGLRKRKEEYMVNKTITKKHRLFALFMTFLMIIGLGNFSKPMTANADTVNVVETPMSTHKWKRQGGV